MCVQVSIPIEFVLNMLSVSSCTSSVDCGAPVAPQNGSLESYSDTTGGAEVFYSCDQHLVPEGRMRTVCTRNGWSPNPADLHCAMGMLSVITSVHGLNSAHFMPVTTSQLN